MNPANRDEAFKCLEVAEAALGRGDTAKAERFALKAQKLFPTDKVRAAADAWPAPGTFNQVPKSKVAAPQCPLICCLLCPSPRLPPGPTPAGTCEARSRAGQHQQ